MKYPIGIQSFEKIIKEGFVYVDKTEQIYNLVNDYQYVFLGRPRRFGKSLLLSTIEAYFKGRKELFKGLAIDELEQEWSAYPVLHFDLNIGNYGTLDGVLEILNVQLSDYEAIYGKNPNLSEPQYRLRWLVRQAYELTGKEVVILVDEYDKPVMNIMDNPEMDATYRQVLKPFYGVLKSEDRYIRFGMLTGVTKFGKLSVFSDLNNIEDISLNKNYASICGITENEILSTFDKEINEFAEDLHVSKDTMITELRRKYDGYRFSKALTYVYNPFSLLNSLKNKELGNFWFETGTPTFLVKMLQTNDYSLSEIDGIEVNESSLYKIDNTSAIAILYQSGYLTIKDYNSHRRLYILGYPNQEVEAGFLDCLLPDYSHVKSEKADSEIFKLIDELEAGDVDAFMKRLKSVFYTIPYSHDNTAKMQEDQFRNLTYLVFKLIGMQIQVECPMSLGRSDAVIWTRHYIYVIEFKINSTPEKAMEQIHEKCYAQPYIADTRTKVLVGVNYSTTARSITGWVSERIG